jgi:hypothetical protein
MNTKTVRLNGESLRIKDGVLEVWCVVGRKGLNERDFIDCYAFDGEDQIWGWKRAKMQVGREVVLVSTTNVSPNSIRSGKNIPHFSIRFAEGGIPGNSNRNICRFHGWRGTTDDVSVDAHGARIIKSIRELKNGDVAITVGRDIRADDA